MKSEMELERQTTRRMDSLQMPSMCAMRSSLAAEASPSVWSFAFIISFHISSGLLIAATQIDYSNQLVFL